MLLLWDHIIEPHAEAIGQLGRADLCQLAVDVMESTAPLFDPPFSEFFPQATASLIESTVAHCKGSAPSWQLDSAFVDGFYERFDSLPEVAIRPGVGPFSMATMRLVGALAESMSADEVLEIMSACYEAILMSQLTGRVTTQMQEENGRCREAIRLQEELIARRSNGQ